MPVRPTYPGVYIEEVPSGVRPITGVATAVAAFVDAFARGPQNVALQLFSFADFEREFGGLMKESPASYAIQQFFLNGGSEAFVVRVGQHNPPLKPFQAAETAVPNQPSGGSDVLAVRAGRRIRRTSVDDPGAWGNNLFVEVDYDTSRPLELFNVTVSEAVVEGTRRIVRRTETYRNLTVEAGKPNSAIEVVNEGSKLVQLAAPTTPPPAGTKPASVGTLGYAIPGAIPASPVALTIRVNAGPIRSLSIEHGLTGPRANDWASFAPLLEAAIRALATDPAVTPLEKVLYEGCRVRILGRLGGTDPIHFWLLGGRNGAAYDPTARLVMGGADALGLSGTGGTVSENVQQYRLRGGGDGDPLALDDATILGSPAGKTGLFALEDVDIFNILCLPRAADLPDTAMRSLYAKAEAYCEERRAFLIVDIPESVDELGDMQAWLLQNESLRHRNAAVYFPRTLIADPLDDNRLRSIAASGTIAGLYARTDAARGVWKAPAGTEARLQNVQDLAYRLTDPQNGALNPLGVNCLRTFPIYSHICWGARTLEGADQLASDWKYVPVRRLTLFLEESLYRGTQWVVFEPNDEPLWAQIRLNVGAFMHDLFRQGAFQGQTPREAYLVKCDRETTTQTDINNGIVNILVGFAPLKPAEFVIIRIQQMAGQIET